MDLDILVFFFFCFLFVKVWLDWLCISEWRVCRRCTLRDEVWEASGLLGCFGSLLHGCAWALCECEMAGALVSLSLEVALSHGCGEVAF